MWPRRTLPSIFLTSYLFGLSATHTAVHDGRFVPNHNLRVTIREVNFGCETRQSLVVNGTSPGPVIRLLPGARAWIRVYNDISDQNLTMHWHGLAQRMAPFADGTPQASQWPIPPGHFFDYEVATEPSDAGTYFYHSHVAMQATTCSGPVVVDDCSSCPFNYDDERILYFQDYLRVSDKEMAEDVQAVPYIWPGETDGIVLNGRSVPIGNKAARGPSGQKGVFGGGHASSPGGNPSPGVKQITNEEGCTLPVIDVEPGKTYRFRIAGATSLSLLSMAIEDHAGFTVIQADGMQYLRPVDTRDLQLGPGQRFDVLFRAKTMDELAADGNKTTYYLQFETRSRPEQLRGYAVIRYDDNVAVPEEPAVSPVDLPADPNGWLEYTFEPLSGFVAPTAAEVTRRITLEVVQLKDNVTGRQIWQLSGITWTEESYKVPLLVDIYQRGTDAMPNYTVAKGNKGWDPQTGSFPIKLGEVVELVIQNTGTISSIAGFVEAHPFHVHSQHVFDIGGGPGVYDADANNAKIDSLGYKPTLRDTTMLYRYKDTVYPGQAAGWRAWRLEATAPGVWMVHCHILTHMAMGMQAIFVVGDASDIMDIAPSDVAGYLDYGGSVYGNSTFAPSPNEYFSDVADKCGVYAQSEDGGQPSRSNTTSGYNSTSEYSDSTSDNNSTAEDEPETDEPVPSMSESSTKSLSTSEPDDDLEVGHDDSSSTTKYHTTADSSPTLAGHAEQTPSGTPETASDSEDADREPAVGYPAETTGDDSSVDDYPATDSAPAASAIPEPVYEGPPPNEEHAGHGEHPIYQGHAGSKGGPFYEGHPVHQDRPFRKDDPISEDIPSYGENTVDKGEHWGAGGGRREQPKRPWEFGKHY
ncbi:multicopper oxidase-domain-containing protein [Pseudoneurospora amorphoporcata]|uniref:Multicopper oxidase-domain-containing protein n=1 Tax=Pseudoneurospora amorphoporcata TaxID=241081 RepID=A0AAN6NNK7_9PEZI|nr:multicopper oxidase-domain-containing protein [Pseudoneurospora amorphoporcata]